METTTLMIILVIIVAVALVAPSSSSSSSVAAAPRLHAPSCQQPLQFFIDAYDDDTHTTVTTYVVDAHLHETLFAATYTELHWSPEYAGGSKDRRSYQSQSTTNKNDDGDDRMIECHYHGYAWRANHSGSSTMVDEVRRYGRRRSDGSMKNVALSTRGNITTIHDMYGIMYIARNEPRQPLQAFMLQPLPQRASSSSFPTSSSSVATTTDRFITHGWRFRVSDDDNGAKKNPHINYPPHSINHQWDYLASRHQFAPFALPKQHDDHEDDATIHARESRATCALTHAMATMMTAAVSSSPPVRMTTQADTRTRYVELLLVNDHLRYANLTSSTEYQTAAIANMAALLYATMTTPPVQIVLVAQISFVSVDPYTVTVSNGANGAVTIDNLLSSFQRWRVDKGQALAAHDVGHLLTGHLILDGTVGLATLGAMCVASVSGGVEQSLNDQSLVYTSVALAHELGHNFGMVHDGSGSGETTCMASGAVMASSFCRNCDLSTFAFSSCSIAALQSFVATSQASCLDNVPTRRWNDSSSGVCGDGVVNANEACDCGGNTDADCVASGDPCCNPLTCQLASGATCSLRDVCCRDCAIITATNRTVCRASTGSCDVAEYCDGTSSTCSTDRWQPQGSNCTATRVAGYDLVAGVCHRGTCASYDNQCERYGRTIDQTANYSACPVLIRNQLTPVCNGLRCMRNGNTGGCFGFTVDGVDVQVEDGISCGLDLQCYEHTCQDTDAVSLFQWYITDWAPCDDPSGTQSRFVSCIAVDEGMVQVSDALCTQPVPVSSMTCDNRATVAEQQLFWSISLTLTTISLICLIFMMVQYCSNAALRARSIAPVLLQLYGDVLLTVPSWLLYLANIIDSSTHGGGLCGINVFFFTGSFIVQCVACALIGWASKKQINGVLAGRGGTWVGHKFLFVVTTLAGIQCGWWTLALYEMDLAGSFRGFFCLARDFSHFVTGGLIILGWMLSFAFAAFPLSKMYKSTTAFNYPNTVLALHIREQIGFATLLVFSWLICWFLWMIMILQDVSGNNFTSSLVMGSMYILQLKPIVDCILVARIPSVTRQWTWRPKCQLIRAKKTPVRAPTANGGGNRVAVSAPRAEAWTSATPAPVAVSSATSANVTPHPMSLEIAALGADGDRLAAAAAAVAANDANRIATTPCPICFQQIPDWQIEMHADDCLNGGPPRPMNHRTAAGKTNNKAGSRASTVVDDGKRSGSSAASAGSNDGSRAGSSGHGHGGKPKKKGSKIVTSSHTAPAAASLPPVIYMGQGGNGIQFPSSALANAPRAPVSAAMAMMAAQSHWNCTICTLKNPRNRPDCSACGSPRPFDL